MFLHLPASNETLHLADLPTFLRFFLWHTFITLLWLLIYECVVSNTGETTENWLSSSLIFQLLHSQNKGLLAKQHSSLCHTITIHPGCIFLIFASDLPRRWKQRADTQLMRLKGTELVAHVTLTKSSFCSILHPAVGPTVRPHQKHTKLKMDKLTWRVAWDVDELQVLISLYTVDTSFRHCSWGVHSTQPLPPPVLTIIPNIPCSRPKSFQGFLTPGPNVPELILPHSVNPATLILH